MYIDLYVVYYLRTYVCYMCRLYVFRHVYTPNIVKSNIWRNSAKHVLADYILANITCMHTYVCIRTYARSLLVN